MVNKKDNQKIYLVDIPYGKYSTSTVLSLERENDVNSIILLYGTVPVDVHKKCDVFVMESVVILSLLFIFF